MKEWRVFNAEGSLRILELKLNEIESSGYVIHSVLPEMQIHETGRVRLTHSMWPIIAFREK